MIKEWSHQIRSKKMKWIFIIVLAAALSLNGCADTADAESSAAITPVDNQDATDSSTDSSGDTVWVAIVIERRVNLGVVLHTFNMPDRY